MGVSSMAWRAAKGVWGVISRHLFELVGSSGIGILIFLASHSPARSQLPKPAGFVFQDTTGAQSIKPLGRGLFLDPANNTIRTLSWGGLFNPSPNVLWLTTGAGGNAQPVEVDTNLFQVVPDPSGKFAGILTIKPGLVLSDTTTNADTVGPFRMFISGGSPISPVPIDTQDTHGNTWDAVLYVDPSDGGVKIRLKSGKVVVIAGN